MDSRHKENGNDHPDEEFSHLMDELELTKRQRNFIELMNDKNTQQKESTNAINSAQLSKKIERMD
ncbi:TPA: hypothetical protein N5O16_004145 [Enterobacter roggenkampii]|nr:hypothetical protein [Enterobacter roggenkampii]